MTVLLCCAFMAATPEVRPTVALVPPVPAKSAEKWIGYAIADNLGMRLLFHSRYDPKTVSRVYPLNVFGWRQTTSAARADGIDVSKPLSGKLTRKLQQQLGADFTFVGSYRVNGRRVYLSWRLYGDPARRDRKAQFDLSNLSKGTDALASDLLTALKQSTKGLEGHRLLSSPLAAMKPYGQALQILGQQSLDPRAHLVLPKGEIERARLLLTAATDAQHDFVRAWVARAVADAMLGKMKQAEADLIQAMASAGEFEPSTSLGLYYVYDRQGETRKAIDVLEEATKTHLGFLHGLGYLGQAYMRANQNHEAVRIFSAYQARVPRSPWARIKRGAALSHIGKHDIAIAETQKVLAEFPHSVMVMTALAMRQIDARKLDDARATITKGLAEHPDHPALLTRLGFVELEQNHPEVALKLAQKAVARLGDGRGEPLAGYAQLNLAYALALLGQTDSALEALQKAKQLGVDAESILVLRRDRRLRALMNHPRNPFRVPSP